MYIEAVPNRNSRPAILLREGWREGRRTRKRTLANLTDWPAAQVEALRAVLKGNLQLLGPPPGFSIERTRPHGQVAAVLVLTCVIFRNMVSGGPSARLLWSIRTVRHSGCNSE